MADDKPVTPEEGNGEKEGDFSYEIDKGGNLILDGVLADRVVHPLLLRENREGKEDEAADQVDDTPEPAAEPAKTATEEQKATPADAPVDGSIETPGRQKFKLKVYGEELEKEFDPDELVSTLQKGLAAEKRFQEVAAKEREIEPFSHIIKTDAFKTWLDEQAAAGNVEAPKPPPPPNPEDVMGYRLRAEEPEFDKIRAAMAEWAVTLPRYEAAQLESNHRVFNMAYDRFKNARQSQQPPKAAEPPIPSREVAEAVLASKERLKETARAERSGVAEEAPNPAKAAQKREADLRRRMRQGDQNAAVELAKMLYIDGLVR